MTMTLRINKKIFLNTIAVLFVYHIICLIFYTFMGDVYDFSYHYFRYTSPIATMLIGVFVYGYLDIKNTLQIILQEIPQ